MDGRQLGTAFFEINKPLWMRCLAVFADRLEVLSLNQAPRTVQGREGSGVAALLKRLVEPAVATNV